MLLRNLETDAGCSSTGSFPGLEQNRKNGSKNLRETLRLEMADAFEQRKHQAKRMGEKAGTKLLIRCFFSCCGDGDDHGSGMDRVWLKEDMRWKSKEIII